MTLVIDPERVAKFVERVPKLLEVAQTLNDAKIPWLIGGSGCLFVFGNERVPEDVDIFVRNEDHDKVDALFGIESFTYTSPLENVRNSNPFGDHALQCTSHLKITKGDRVVNFEITSVMITKSWRAEHNGVALFFMPPEDPLLIKALLNRGPEVGKHDREDIAKFLQIRPNIDRVYLENRTRTLGLKEEETQFFKGFTTGIPD